MVSSKKEVSKGVFLVCFGKRGYAFSAYNLAFSIKSFNPKIKVAILHDENSFQHLNQSHKDIFDIRINEIKNTDCPANIKASVYKYLPFDYNLFIDVDACALKDIEPLMDELIEKGGYYYSHIVGTHTIDKGRDFNAMQWAWADDIWKHYKLSDQAVMPATNSSFQFIKKCKESEALFIQLKKNIDNPIPLDKLRMKWGGSQPDELYLNVALAQKKISGDPQKEYIFFGRSLDKRTLTQLVDDFYLLSFYGGSGFTRLKYIEWYDRLMYVYHAKKGLQRDFKIQHILPDKHANKK